MILPCNQSQFEALTNMFNTIMYSQPADIKQSLAYDLLEPIKDKLNRRMKAKFAGKRGWNISLTPLQAKSYYSFFHGRHLGDRWMYEAITIDKHLTLIEKTYG